jgi:hypothetical protein
MTSTPQEPGRRSRRTRHRRTSTSVRAAHGRHRALSSTPAPRRARPTTLWSFADADALPGTALLAGWLGRTIITLVTTYTRPGDRVLLLAPPASTRVPSWPSGGARGEDPYTGLTEAVWTVARLGRSADTATATPTPDHVCDRTDPTVGDGGESGSRPRPCRCGLRPPADPDAETGSCPDSATCSPRGRFDLIISAVNPHDTDWLTDADWDTSLTPTGLAAVLTHSGFRRGRLLDPHRAIMDTFHHRQLGCLDHIAVLDAPPADREPAAAPNSTAPAHCSSPRGGMHSLWPLRPGHHDLLLLGRLTRVVPGTGGSEGQETSDV